MSPIKKGLVLLILLNLNSVFGNHLMLFRDEEEEISGIIMNVIESGRGRNDWNNILCVGNFSDAFHKALQKIPSTFVITKTGRNDHDIDGVVPYASSTILFKCLDLKHFENLLTYTAYSPHWHPLSNVILFYQSTTTPQLLGKLFFIFWYYKVINSIIVTNKDVKESLLISYYSPYISENYKLPNLYGCWSVKSVKIPTTDFNKGLICVEGCHNLTQNRNLRANKLGTCIGYATKEFHYNSSDTSQSLMLFEDKTRNLHGFEFKVYVVEAKPFLIIDVGDNGSWSMHARDGMIWNTASKYFNFTMSLIINVSELVTGFNFEHSVQQIYEFSHRKFDLFLMPVYLMDLLIVSVDYTTPFKESGLCFLAPRAGFETALFDIKLLNENYGIVIEFAFCVMGVWFVFFIFNAVEKGTVSFNQAGKDLVNVVRSILSITLYKAPKGRMFRIFLAPSIWSFFILNFFTQAAIISFFSSFKRGPEVNTFDDVIEKGYIIEGMGSPDAMLPSDEEKFNLLNSKIVPTPNFSQCPDRMVYDSHRFCLIDCAVAHYYVRNKLNAKGEQYMHLVEQDKIHSHYITILLQNYSPLTKQFNKLIQTLFETGLIKKWEEYRYSDIKDDVQIKALGMHDMFGIFACFGLLLGLCLSIFMLEVTLGFIFAIKKSCKVKIWKWNKTRIAKKKIQLELKMGKIKYADSTTQT